MKLFEVSGLRTGYERSPVLEHISFTAGAGTITGILGANGSGKTTLLKSICGILPHGGGCLLDGQALEGLSPRQMARLCSYIPQKSGIGIDISALDVVLMGFNACIGILEHPSTEMRRQAGQALECVGLGGFEARNYLTLSEGEKQLCILARTLVSRGKLLLLDEPESALDFRYRNRMLKLVRQWIGEEKRCALIALHDPQLPLNNCDQLLLLGSGGIVDTLHPAEDSVERMESALGRIYGRVSIVRCANRHGKDQLVMLPEQEDGL